MKILHSAVRELYADDPIIESLRSFALGSEITPIGLATANLQRNVSDKRIYEALDLLENLATKSNVYISLDAIEQIKSARNGKAGLRFELSMFVSSLWDALDSKDEIIIEAARKQGAAIVQMIDLLNGQLKLIDSSLREESLNHG